MAYLMGDNIQLGIGMENPASRGTAVAPQIWLPARSPATVNAVVDTVAVRETMKTGIRSSDSSITQVRAEGDVEFNVRVASIGYILKSLLGSVTSNTALGATTHTFTRQTESPLHPSLTLGLAQPNHQDYSYDLSVVSSLEIRTPIDDLVNATASFVSKAETEIANYTPTFTLAEDVFFRNHDITVKFATNVAGLSGASAICVKDMSVNVSNNVRPNQCLNSANSTSPADVFTLDTEIGGSLTVDYEGATAYHDVFVGQDYQAMEIKMIRDDLPVLGTSTDYYSLTITLPKVSFSSYSAERPIDDIVTENVEFMAHYDTTEAKAIEVELINELADYDNA